MASLSTSATLWALQIFSIYVHVISSTMVEETETLRPYHVFKNGHTLVSKNQVFEMGFFNACSPDGCVNNKWYMGIWYKGIEPLTVVWVANRRDPLHEFGARLVLNSNGDLILGDEARHLVSLSKVNQPVVSPLLVLLDSGNLVIKDGSNQSGRYVWQSFDYPSDTLLPGMKLGWDSMSRTDCTLTSWMTSKDPSYGDFLLSFDSPEAPQILLEKNVILLSRWGPWDGQSFSGSDAIKENPVFKPIVYARPNEGYFAFEILEDSVLVRLVVSPLGAVQFLKWKNTTRVWIAIMTVTKDICDKYGSCGPYGICSVDEPGCRCLEGFVAHSPHDWKGFDRTDGCRRKFPLNCSDNDGFIKYEGLKLPDGFLVRNDLTADECGDDCLRDCTCMAYTNIDIYGNGSQCVMWSSDLVDIRDSTHGGNELYIRMARGELEAIAYAKRKKEAIIIVSILMSTIGGVILWSVISYYIDHLKEGKKQAQRLNTRYLDPLGQGDQDVPLFEFTVISAATNDFSVDNKIGQGGFGPVYKGQLPDGQQIAVKRLSRESRQGPDEFRNEVTLIAQLQHRNLVKLLGCCTHGEERMLVYDYMPNKSLDKFIFNDARKRLLPWEKRFAIVKGIAKGLNYLHYESILRIIHRDLKASNVLLDDEMNPKISDFGVARIFVNEREETTRMVMGTHGYISPEYVLDGHYSTKSDVFSFGVLALEIISGERNWGFQRADHDFNLLGHAWKLWNEGRAMELVDPVLRDSLVEEEVLQCMQVGLLCVQHRAEERPTMAEAISLLQNEGARLVDPREPAFFRLRASDRIGGLPSWALNQDSVNGLTTTTLSGRS